MCGFVGPSASTPLICSWPLPDIGLTGQPTSAAVCVGFWVSVQATHFGRWVATQACNLQAVYVAAMRGEILSGEHVREGRLGNRIRGLV